MRGHKYRAFPGWCFHFLGEESMRQLGQRLWNFVKNEDGPTAVEYAVMLALIIVVCIAAISVLGSNANNTFNKTATAIGTAS
jgi:pilus assembly protein Flp/PilA